MNRRDLLKLLLASAAAEAVDFEQLLWVPKPIITVPATPAYIYHVFDKEVWFRMGPVTEVELGAFLRSLPLPYQQLSISGGWE